MIGWGTVPEWIAIVAGAFVFVVGNVVVYVLVRRDVASNKSDIGIVKQEIESLKTEQLAVKTLASCLDRTEAAHDRIEKLSKEVVTIRMHDDMQEKCQGRIMTLIDSTVGREQAMKEDITEIKNAVKEQAQAMNQMAVAVASLATKIDERTGNSTGTRLDRAPYRREDA